jgi:flagellin
MPLHIQGGKIMIVQHNMAALNTNRQLGATNTNLAKSTEKLSSGYRINRAGDDAAGLTISEKMRSQIRGLEQGSTNAQDGISLIQTAEGALNEVHSVLQRMRELAVQGANDTNVTADRTAITKEMTALKEEIGRIGDSTEYNTMKLLNGDFVASDKFLQVGANQNTGDGIGEDGVGEQTIKLKMVTITADGSITSADGNTEASLEEAIPEVAEEDMNEAFRGSIEVIDKAIKAVSSSRSDLGAIQNRLEHTIANADNTAENLQAAESRIRDVNMADEMVKYSKSNILQQAGQSMLAQANQQTQGVLSLLR